MKARFSDSPDSSSPRRKSADSGRGSSNTNVSFLTQTSNDQGNTPPFGRRRGAVSTPAITSMPVEISIVAGQIAAYESANPATAATVAAQLALWAAQGRTLDEIGERFEFSMEDVAMMREILATEIDGKAMPD